MGGACRDDLRTKGYFPVQWKCGSIAQFGPRVLAQPHHDRAVDKPVRRPDRHGVDDDLQRRGVGGVAVTLTIEKFGLDSEFGGFGKKVHWARGLHATLGGVANMSNWET